MAKFQSCHGVPLFEHVASIEGVFGVAGRPLSQTASWAARPAWGGKVASGGTGQPGLPFVLRLSLLCASLCAFFLSLRGSGVQGSTLGHFVQR